MTDVGTDYEYTRWLLGLNVQDYTAEGKHQRRGQYAFNTLADVRPDIAEKIRGTLSDPFYQDKKLDEFHEIVRKEW